MDFNQFVEGLRAMGLPNERAVYLAYTVAEGLKAPSLQERVGSYGMEQVQQAIRAVEARAAN